MFESKRRPYGALAEYVDMVQKERRIGATKQREQKANILSFQVPTCVVCHPAIEKGPITVGKNVMKRSTP